MNFAQNQQINVNIALDCHLELSKIKLEIRLDGTVATAITKSV